MAKDENYRRRVELIQDLEFPTASQVRPCAWMKVYMWNIGGGHDGLSTHPPTYNNNPHDTTRQRIKMSPDGQYVVATGTYPPAIRVYEVAEMSMKFERRLTAEVREMDG